MRYSYNFSGVNPEFLASLQSQVRIGGKGSSRRKKKSVKGELIKKDINISKKHIKFDAPTKFEKDECCVCYERVKLSKENTIDCNGKTKALCSDCKVKMKKDVCPLCNNHSIGLKIKEQYEYPRRIFLPRAPRSERVSVIWNSWWLDYDIN